MKRIVPTAPARPSPPSYSQAVVAAGLVFVSGQGPFDPRSGEVVGAMIEEQTAHCLRNVAAILEAGGSSLAKLVSATFILAEKFDFPGVNEMGQWFPVEPPSRQGATLPIRPKGLKAPISHRGGATFPSSGRPVAGFASFWLPLMSDVKQHEPQSGHGSSPG